MIYARETTLPPPHIHGIPKISMCKQATPLLHYPRLWDQYRTITTKATPTLILPPPHVLTTNAQITPILVLPLHTHWLPIIRHHHNILMCIWAIVIPTLFYTPPHN